MIPTQFKEANFEYGKPETMTDEICMALPVFKGIDSNNFPVIVSCWKLNYEELKEIQKTGCVYLMIVGESQPPVSLHIETPFNNPII